MAPEHQSEVSAALEEIKKDWANYEPESDRLVREAIIMSADRKPTGKEKPKILGLSDEDIERALQVLEKAPKARFDRAKEVLIDPEKKKEGKECEDAGFNNGRLMIVCDGLGSYKGGAEASKSALDEIKNNLRESVTGEQPVVATSEYAQDRIKKAITKANEMIAAKRKMFPDEKEMATTATVGEVFFDPDENKYKLAYGQVGDSRLYKFNTNTGELQRVTPEHSLTGVLEMNGYKIDDSDLRITLEEAFKKAEKIQPIKNNPETVKKIIETWGGKTLESLRTTMGVALDGDAYSGGQIMTGTTDIEPGVLFMSCSDGFTDNYTDASIGRKLQELKGLSFDQMARHLAAFAAKGQMKEFNDRAKGTDDITINITEVKLPIAAESKQIAA